MRKKVKCSGCKGTGYRSAAKEAHMEDAPRWARPFGIWRCSECDGTGRVADIEAWVNDWWRSMSKQEQDELRDKLSEHLAKLPIAQ